MDSNQRSALLSDLRDFFRRWGCISIETSDDTVEALVPEAASERQCQLEIRTCLDAWLARHPDVEAEIIA